MQAHFQKVLQFLDLASRFFFQNAFGVLDRDWPSLFYVPHREVAEIMADANPPLVPATAFDTEVEVGNVINAFLHSSYWTEGYRNSTSHHPQIRYSLLQGVVYPTWEWGRAQHSPYYDYMHCRNIVYNMLRILRYNFRCESPLTIPLNLDGTPAVVLDIDI